MQSETRIVPTDEAARWRRHLARFVLMAFLLTFIVARVLVYLIMIRRIPDFYMHLGGTHVHHLNYGIFALSFPPEEARRLIDRLEMHYTPQHGSWLNMAETELSVLSRQCLVRRIPDRPMLDAETAAWEQAQLCPLPCRLAVHHRRRPHRTQTPLPVNTTRLRH